MGKGLLFIVVLFIGAVFIYFGWYGFFIRPGFLAGGETTSLFLLRSYESFAPYAPLIVVGVMVALWIITTPAAIFGMPFADMTSRTLKVLPFMLIVSGISSLPAFFQSHDYLDQIDFGEQSYNLVKRDEMGEFFRYGVIECDSFQRNCRQIYLTNQLPDSLDTGTMSQAVPTRVVEVNGERVILNEQPGTTLAEPVAELIYDTTSQALGLRIANQYQTIAVPTPDPGFRIQGEE